MKTQGWKGVKKAAIKARRRGLNTGYFKQEKDLKEELRMLNLDLHEAYRRDDKTGVVEIQERIAGLSRLNNKGTTDLMALVC